MSATWLPQSYQIVMQDSSSIPVGSVVYLQDGIQGTPRGLLLSLTYSSNIISKNIKTSQGLRTIT